MCRLSPPHGGAKPEPIATLLPGVVVSLEFSEKEERRKEIQIRRTEIGAPPPPLPRSGPWKPLRARWPPAARPAPAAREPMKFSSRLSLISSDFNEIRSRTFTRFLQHTEKQINELSFLNRKSIFVIMIRGKIRCSISIQFSPTPRISSERRDDFLDAASRGSAPRGGQKRVRVAAPATTICDKSISRFFDGFSATFFSQILLPSKQRGFRVLSTSTLTSYHPKECFSLLHSTLLKGRRARARGFVR